MMRKQQEKVKRDRNREAYKKGKKIESLLLFVLTSNM
jgi:hypothetical protein